MKKQVLFGGKVAVAFSELSDGNMRFFNEGVENATIKNQEMLGRFINLDVSKIARIRVTYDNRKNYTQYDEISNLNIHNYRIQNSEANTIISDGLTTRLHDIGILLPLADCLGIVVFDENNSALGLVHSGRQNIEENGAKKFIEFFVKQYNSNVANLKVYFSPHAINYHIFKLDKNLPDAATEQLIDAGILPENIINPGIDTVTSPFLPSYSSGDAHQRFAIVVRQF